MIEEKFKEAIAKMYPVNPPDENVMNVLRHSFFAGWGECLHFIEQEIPKVPITEAVMISNAMKVEYSKFWGMSSKPKLIVEP